MIQNDIFQFRTLINEAQKILIALSSDCDEDEMAGALALYLVLKKNGKQVDVVTSRKTRVEHSYLYAIDKIKNDVTGGNDAIISFPYKEGAVEKVSYNIENDRFNVVIQPRGEAFNFNSSEVDFHMGRGDFDMLIAIGADDLAGLGQVYQKIQKSLKDQPIVNFDKSSSNTRFGRINLLNTASVSRAVALVLKFLNMQLDADIASNLLTGLFLSMKSTSMEIAKPEDLEAAAYLLRFGAKNLKKERKEQKVEEKPKKSADFFEEKKVQAVKSGDNEVLEQTPEDWLKPKIYTTKKTSDLI